MKYLGATFYNGDGNVKTQPSDIAPRSTGNGGTLAKVGGFDGKFGRLAYSCPDPNQMLVIYITMAALSGTLNHCYVRLESSINRLLYNFVQLGCSLAPSSTPVRDQLATDAYNLRLAYETEGIMNYPFTQSGKSFSMQVGIITCMHGD